jgi:hypothetical protein
MAWTTSDDTRDAEFKDLPGRLQNRLLEYPIVLHLIRRGTPSR